MVNLTPIQRRILTASGAIVDSQADDPLYTHSVLAQTYFPTTKQPDSVRQWQRKQGHAHLKVDAGQAWHPGRQEFVDMPLPYGPKARLILMHLNSEAVRQRSHVIEVDRSMTAFVARVQDRQPNSRDIAMFKSRALRTGSGIDYHGPGSGRERRTGANTDHRGIRPLVRENVVPARSVAPDGGIEPGLLRHAFPACSAARRTCDRRTRKIRHGARCLLLAGAAATSGAGGYLAIHPMDRAL